MALVPDVVIVFRLNGERKDLSYRKLPFSVWSELKQQLGFTPATLLDAVQNVDMEGLGAIIWLERKQRERQLRWPEVRALLEREEIELEFLEGIVNGVALFGADLDAEPDPTPASS